MKKQIFYIFLAVLILSGCSEISDEATESASLGNISDFSGGSSQGTSSTTTTTSSESENFTYSTDSNIFEVSSSVSSVTISGLSNGKTLYLAKTNPYSSSISASYTRYVTGGSGVSLSSGDASSDSSSNSGSSGSGKSSGHSGFGPHHCISLSLSSSLPQISENSSRVATSSLTKVTPTVYTESDVGTATRSIYVDQDSDISTFAAETATLRAVGSFCYVWVVSENWTEGSASGEKINSEIAKNIATNFDTMYEKIRAVFGEESDELSANTSLSSKVAMADYSETGEIVNIVIYDIGKDYEHGTNSGDVVGYFYAKDYFCLSNATSVYKYSNKGKYFYVDGYFAANDTSTVYSTLAHEFQHMIDFGVKTMEQGLSSSTAHNEMKSMLCEDIMYSSLSELDSNFTEDDSPVARLPLFNRHYADVGLEYKSTSPEVYYSYANNYAFGAWLLRSYGGIELLHKIATNDCTDEKAILAALKTTGASDTTMEAVLKNYALSCILSDESAFSTEFSDSELHFSGFDYSLIPIDLWNLESALPETYSECKNSTSYYKFDGPYLYGYNKQAELRPYGLTLGKIGSATGDEVTINFNTTGISTAQKVYVVVSD